MDSLLYVVSFSLKVFVTFLVEKNSRIWCFKLSEMSSDAHTMKNLNMIINIFQAQLHDEER